MNNIFGRNSVSVRNITIALIGAIIFTACKKPEFDSELLNPSDQIHLMNDSSLAIHTSLEREDSVRSDELSVNLLGAMNDPLLGYVSAGIFAQMRMPATNLNFGESPLADSLILVLPYNGGSYGNIESTQRFYVYRLTQDIYADSTYYSNDVVNYEQTPIGISETLKPAPGDSIILNGKKLKPQLRIKLSNELAQQFLNEPAHFTDNTAFLNFFKGVYIQAELTENQPGNGAVLDFRLTNGAGLELHYHNNTADSLIVAFNINENSARFNHFNRTYSPEINALLNTPALGQQHTYIANMAGLRTKIELPNLYAWKGNRKILINKARLIFPVDPNTLGKYPANPQLSVLTKDKDGTLINISDNFLGSDYVGGKYDATKNQYIFNISRQIQELIDNESIPFYGLYIQPLGTAVSSYRVRLNGGENPDKPAKIELLYQILPSQ